jgi:hypothetical protein
MSCSAKVMLFQSHILPKSCFTKVRFYKSQVCAKIGFYQILFYHSHDLPKSSLLQDGILPNSVLPKSVLPYRLTSNHHVVKWYPQLITHLYHPGSRFSCGRHEVRRKLRCHSCPKVPRTSLLIVLSQYLFQREGFATLQLNL